MTIEKHKIVSYSQYKMWATCPLMWKLAYVDKLSPDEKTIHHIFGSAMHDVIQFWLGVLFNESKMKALTLDLSDMLKERMSHHFRESIKEENGSKVFVCDKQTLVEFYDDGVEILRYIQTHSTEFFPTSDWTLEGVELPLRVPLRDGVHFIGYCDIILRHKLTGAIKIIDLKTSTKGWNKWKREDKLVTDQLVLYKYYYAQQFNIPEASIEVEFLILKRKLWEESPYPQKRVSGLKPATGGPSLVRASKSFTAFVNECFDDQGEYKVDTIKATPSKSACRFCPFNNKSDLCSVSEWKE